MDKLRRSPMAGYAGQAITVEKCKKHVRISYGGEIIADSHHTLVLNETAYRPVFYFPRKDVRMELLQSSEHRSHCPFKGDAVYWALKYDNTIVENIAWSYETPYREMINIKGYLAFDSMRTDNRSMNINQTEQEHVVSRTLYQEIKE